MGVLKAITIPSNRVPMSTNSIILRIGSILLNVDKDVYTMRFYCTPVQKQTAWREWNVKR
jgi:hypothetical protein